MAILPEVFQKMALNSDLDNLKSNNQIELFNVIYEAVFENKGCFKISIN